MKTASRIISFILILTMLFSMAVFADGEVEGYRDQLSQGQKNIVLRARQLAELQWTPLYDRYQWGYQGTFSSGTTYTGVPYGQPVFTGYIGYGVSLDTFVAATEDNTSHFYTRYSNYNKIAPSYSIDCSGFISYAWGLKARENTSSLPSVSYKVDDQSLSGLQVGDCLNDARSHAVLVSDVVKDPSGNVISVEIMEQTPVITRVTRYGEGGEKTLDQFKNYYFGGGYAIYRNPERDSVEYVHSCAVPLDGEWCENCRRHAPYASVSAESGGSMVWMGYDDPSADIYYTTDGSDPEIYGTEYTEPIMIGETTTIKACAVFPDGSVSRVLSYKVSVVEEDGFSSFDDVSADAWYAPAVDFACVRGLFRGVTESEFAPDSTMTRGMFVTVLGRMAGLPADLYGRIGVALGDGVNVRAAAGIDSNVVASVNYYETFSVLGWENGWYKVDVGGVVGYIREDYVKAYTGRFADLDESMYYSPYVQWALLTGISSGTGAATFEADANISRENMASMLYNYSQNHFIDLPAVNEKAAFSDDGSISAKDAVYAFQQAGVINGMGDGSFVPGGSATRAQVASIFMKYISAAGE